MTEKRLNSRLAVLLNENITAEKKGGGRERKLPYALSGTRMMEEQGSHCAAGCTVPCGQ